MLYIIEIHTLEEASFSSYQNMKVTKAFACFSLLNALVMVYAAMPTFRRLKVICKKMPYAKITRSI